MEYVCDNARHLVCLPYSIANLHQMAKELGIKKCWFHKNHYDIPKRRIEEITAKCKVVDKREIVLIIKGKYMSQVCILAEFKVLEDKIDECKVLFNELAEKSLEEDGCMGYVVKQVSRDEQWFIAIEVFENKEAQEFHKTTSHYLEILKEQLEPLIIEKKVRFLI